MKAYIAMGSPRYPTRTQVQQMNAASALGAPEKVSLHDSTLTLDLKPNELVLLRISATSARGEKNSAHSKE